MGMAMVQFVVEEHTTLLSGRVTQKICHLVELGKIVIPKIHLPEGELCSIQTMGFKKDPMTGDVVLETTDKALLQYREDCWERRNMDPSLNPSGRLVGPVIRTYTRHFWRSPREPEEQSY